MNTETDELYSLLVPLVGERLLRPDFCLRDGVRFDADASILPVVEAA